MSEPAPRPEHATLRVQLTAVPGAGLPKRVWNDLLRLLRARRRRTGQAPQALDGQAAIQRALDSRPVGIPSQLVELRDHLHALVDAEGSDAEDAAARVESLLLALLPTIRREPVAVTVDGWPPTMTPEERHRVLGPDRDTALLDPLDAAQLRHELDGLDLGGSLLRVAAVLRAGEVLPPLPRARRAGPLRRDGEAPWLPHLDEVGRWSASPRHIAQRHAALFVAEGLSVVLDPFCGCGADAVALCRAGLRVLGAERDVGRAELARRNLAALAPRSDHEVEGVDGLSRLAAWRRLHPQAGLYLDPPWGSAEAGAVAARTGLSWATLFEDSAAVVSAIDASPLTVIKLPRDFDLASLPGVDWSIHWQFGLPEHGSDRIVKAISAVRRGAIRPR